MFCRPDGMLGIPFDVLLFVDAAVQIPTRLAGLVAEYVDGAGMFSISRMRVWLCGQRVKQI